MGVLLLKELLQTVREWRALALVFLTPALFSWLAAWALERAFRAEEIPALPRYRLVISPSDTLPEPVTRRFRVVGMDDPQQAVLDRVGEIGLVRVQDTFKVFYRKDDPQSLDAFQALQTLLEDLREQDLKAFLSRAGYRPPFEILPVAVGSEAETANPWTRQIQRFSTRFIVYLAMVFLLMASMQIATDLSIGEKERGTMEPFLATGVSREGIVMSKMVIATLAGMIAAGIVLFNLRNLQFGPSSSPEAWRLVAVWVLLLPAGLVSALSFLLVGSFAASIKEAQALNGLVLTIYFGAVSLSALPFSLPFVNVLPVGSLTHYLNLFLAGFPVGQALGLNAGLHLIWALLLFWLALSVYRRGWLWLR